MSRELTIKEISYIRSALEGYIGILVMDGKSGDLHDDERLDTQDDLLVYGKLLHTFKKIEKQSTELCDVQSFSISQRETTEKWKIKYN